MANGNRGAAYWAGRRRKQGGRAAGKALKAYANPTIPNIARAAWSGVKYLRTLVNSELHRLDITASGAVLSTTAGITHLTQIAQSDTSTGRTGNQILLSFINLRAALVSHASSIATIARVMVVLDKQQIADTAPGIGDILELGTSPLSHYASLSVGRFQILYDRTFQFDNLSKRSFIIKKHLKVNQHVRFNGTGASDQQRNAAYLVILSNEGINTATMDYRIRLGWHDN